MGSELFEALKKAIEIRHAERLLECQDSDQHDRILRVQGAARELKELLGVMEQLENPQKMGED